MDQKLHTGRIYQVHLNLPQIGSASARHTFFVLQYDLFNNQYQKESKANDKSSHWVINFGVVLLFNLVQDVIHGFVYVWEEIQNAGGHKNSP